MVQVQVQIIFLETMYTKFWILYGGIIIGVIKKGVLTEAGPVIRTNTVATTIQ